MKLGESLAALGSHFWLSPGLEATPLGQGPSQAYPTLQFLTQMMTPGRFPDASVGVMWAPPSVPCLSGL